MTAYLCSACKRELFRSDAELGRVQIVCRNVAGSRECGRRQTVFLGGRKSRDEVETIRMRTA